MGSTFVQKAKQTVVSAVVAMTTGSHKLGINDLTLSGCASFTDPVKISLKRYNFIYGLNGTGKTTISTYLSDYQNTDYSKCSINWVDADNKADLLVYNQGFVENNFMENPLQKGIFTLDQENTEAVSAIANAEEEILKLETQAEPITATLQAFSDESARVSSQLKESVWKQQVRFDNTPLKECMESYRGSKDRFLQQVLGSEISPIEKEEIPARLSKLQEEMAALTSSNLQPKNPYNLLNENCLSIESHTIFQEKIIGSNDSYLSDLILKLNHESWVNQGIEKYIDHNDECPFCKQHMDEDLKENIRSHLDIFYKQKVGVLKQQQTAYNNQVIEFNSLISIYKEDEVLKKSGELTHLLETIERALKANISQIEAKVQDPSLAIELESTEEFIVSINEIIASENTILNEFNSKIDNKKSSILAIKNEFWQLVRKETDEVIKMHAQAEEARAISIGEATQQLEAVRGQVAVLRASIKESQGKTKNVDEAVSWINGQIGHLGLEGFSIEKFSKDDAIFYQISRPDKTDAVFTTLSEGEKTLISFLYFLKLCLGDDNIENPKSRDNRVVVIDDPISSLSFNLVFDVACLIKRVFFAPEAKFRQVIILTHHLYFMHELFHQVHPKKDKDGEKDYALFRLIKNQRSQIEPISRNAIQNTYQSYWQTLKDVQEGRASQAILANTMRNIVEHYFSFIHGQAKLSEAFKALKDKHPDSSFAAFDRYVNRESHSDMINLTDLKEIHVEKFMGYFKEVFIHSGFESHYDTMMGTSTKASEAYDTAA